MDHLGGHSFDFDFPFVLYFVAFTKRLFPFVTIATNHFFTFCVSCREMRRRISHILLWIPLIVVITHAVVPHHHFTERAETTLSQGHTCPQSFLSDLFDLDLGSHHLEDYEASRDQVEFTADFIAVLLAIYTPYVETEASKPFVASAEPLQQQIFQSSNALRGPPVLLG